MTAATRPPGPGISGPSSSCAGSASILDGPSPQAATLPEESSGESSLSRAFLYARLVLTALFWGGTCVAGRMVSRESIDLSLALGAAFTLTGVYLTNR